MAVGNVEQATPDFHSKPGNILLNLNRVIFPD